MASGVTCTASANFQVLWGVARLPDPRPLWQCYVDPEAPQAIKDEALRPDGIVPNEWLRMRLVTGSVA